MADPDRMKKATLLCSIAFFAWTISACSPSAQPPDISFYLAVERSDIEQIKKHIRAGTDLNELNPDGERAIHVASMNGRIDILRLLISSHRLDLDALDSQERTALYYALLSGKEKAAELLRKSGAKLDASQTLLDIASAGTQQREGVDFLLTQGANLEARNPAGDTALLIAIRANNHRLARHLVASGSDVNVTDASGNSALAIANQLGLGDIALLLKRNGAQ